ncbi:unnamed protein product [Protopolystoma xenopodis]|uniref:Uncharacterized protein n=1 Tax=Protopolystoma xenopodis TaxID=117903 RepID=A0A448X111_9PLAT|nr:unnamed protein product [Protopolystoma xenopodis]
MMPPEYQGNGPPGPQPDGPGGMLSAGGAGPGGSGVPPGGSNQGPPPPPPQYLPQGQQPGGNGAGPVQFPVGSLFRPTQSTFFYFLQTYFPATFMAILS